MTNEEEIERAHVFDGYGDTLFPVLAEEHPECCSRDEDYPGWDPSMGCCKAPAPKPKRLPTVREAWAEAWALSFTFKAWFALSAMWTGFTAAEIINSDTWREASLFGGLAVMWAILTVVEYKENNK
jgi:hypothetical protein